MIRVLLFVCIYTVACQITLRQYIIEEDYFRGWKAREFSIYYPRKENLHYRIESYLSFRQSIRLVIYPAKKTVGKLHSYKKGKEYQAKLKLYDVSSKKWIKGLVQQHYRALGHNWTINWNGSQLSMMTEPASLTTCFYDMQHNHTLLADFRIRLQSLIWVNVYDMKIYSNVVPDHIYLLSLAVKDHASQWKEAR